MLAAYLPPGVALELDKMFAKGYYRRAASYMAMGKYKKARYY